MRGLSKRMSFKNDDLCPTPKPWFSEPNLGGSVGDDLPSALFEEIAKCSHWSRGFHPSLGHVESFENAFNKFFGHKHSIAVCNNGVGFDLILNFLKLKKNEEAIIPALNFKAWHMALIGRGVKMRLCDVDLDTLNMSAETIEPLINRNTRLICITHYSGLPCDNEKIKKLAKYYEKKYGKKIWLIEDCARGIGLSSNLGPVGIGTDAAIFSFHSAKLMSTLGEGGMISTHSTKLAKFLRNSRNYGGEKGWGLNFKLSPIQAFAGVIQLQHFQKSLRKRKAIGKKWINRFDKMNSFIRIPTPFKNPENVFYIFPVLLPREHRRKQTQLMKELESTYGLVCGKPKIVNNRWEFLKKIDPTAKIPNSIDAEKQYIYLPFHYQYNSQETDYVFKALNKEFKKYS